MVTIRSLDRPTAGACPCGGVMQPATRYEATRTLPVLACWTCGAETPPYRRRVVAPASRRSCAWCGERFATTNPRRLTCSADCEQRRRAAREIAVLEGQRNRRVS